MGALCWFLFDCGITVVSGMTCSCPFVSVFIIEMLFVLFIDLFVDCLVSLFVSCMYALLDPIVADITGMVGLSLVTG